MMAADTKDEIQSSLKRIEDLLTLILFSQRARILEYALDVVRSSKRRMEVFSMLDGTLTAVEIARRLKMKRPNVSVEIRKLYDAGLIELPESSKGNRVYQRGACFDLIGLSGRIRAELKRKSRKTG